MNYSNSITDQTMASVKKKWTEELNDNATWLTTETQEEIFEFLNDRKNLCTAEFILRRQIQMLFPTLVQEAAEKAGLAKYADLTRSGNVIWETKLIDELSRLLANKKFPAVSEKILDSRQWKKILLGEAACNRDTAIKLIFALQMDEATAAKFMITNGKNLFSTRNPFDYICNFCFKGHFTYDTALAMLHDFETQRQNFAGDKNQKPVEFATILLENETANILADDKLTPKVKQARIVKYMLEHQQEFVTKVERKTRRAEYPSGFSKQNNLKLKIFLRYLTELYPTFLQWKEVKELDFYYPYLFSKEVQKHNDGTPKNPEQLLQAMRESQEIYFWETEELEEIGLPTIKLNEKGERQLKAKQEYDAIPFNSEILLPFKNLSKTLRSNLRAEEHPDNAQEIDRSTILFLTYFFISGCQAQKNNINKLVNALDKEIAAEKNPEKNNLLYALKAVINNVESLEYGENPIELHIDSLNRLLESFHCNEFYAPFLIDKFILFCLLTLRRPKNDEDLPHYLMNLLIEESYHLSKKILEGKANAG